MRNDLVFGGLERGTSRKKDGKIAKTATFVFSDPNTSPIIAPALNYTQLKALFEELKRISNEEVDDEDL